MLNLSKGLVEKDCSWTETLYGVIEVLELEVDNQ